MNKVMKDFVDKLEKKKINKRVFYKFNNMKPITWKDVKDFKFEDDDILKFGYVESWENGSDNSDGDHYEAEVYRMVLETDEEFEKRVKEFEYFKEESRKRRYENYLKLKEEFENVEEQQQKDTLEQG
jgi:hypothetical protein